MKRLCKLSIIIIVLSFASCKATKTPPTKTTYDVVLKDISSASKLTILKYVYELNKMNMEDAKKMINEVPVTIKSGISMEEATKIKQELEALKATIEIK